MWLNFLQWRGQDHFLQSFATLQNGDFDIVLDGDLFKAVVKLPIYHKKDQSLESVKLDNSDFDSLNFEGLHFDEFNLAKPNFHDLNNSSTYDELNLDDSNTEIKNFDKSKCKNINLNNADKK